MFIFSRVVLLILAMAYVPLAMGDGPNLGQPASPSLLASWDISIAPDGLGLPPGHGTPQQGAVVYAAKCVSCHGVLGLGGPAPELTGGIGSLITASPRKSVASYWPYATTIFDYIRRAMPVQNPQS